MIGVMWWTPTLQSLANAGRRGLDADEFVPIDLCVRGKWNDLVN